MSKSSKEQMEMQWAIMKSMSKNFGGAATPNQIIEDLRNVYALDRIVENLAELQEAGIISFSVQSKDYIFHPEVAQSKLVSALRKKLANPPITLEEYVQHGWRKLAGLI